MQNLLQDTCSFKELNEDHIFRKLFESSVEGIIILNSKGAIMAANPRFLEMFGYKKEELLYQSIELLFPQGYQVFYSVDAKNKKTKCLLDGIHKKTGLFPVEISLSKAEIDDQDLTIGFLIDVTDRIKAEQERSQFSRIFDESLNEIYILDFYTWKFLSVNKGALCHLGYTREEMKQMTIMDINPSFNEEEIREVLFPLVSNIKNKIHFETIRRKKNGQSYPVETHIQLTNYFSKKAFLIITLDISERKKLQHGLINAVIAGQEKERKRIAKELHNSLGQHLSAINFNLNTLGYNIRGNLKNEEMVDNIRSILNSSVEELHSISQNLYPRILENYGLPKAVKNLCDSIGRSKSLTINLHTHGLDTRLYGPIEIGLYRVTQELINNILKHAEAREVDVHLTRHDKSLILLVEDNGSGFDAKDLSEYRFDGSGIGNIITQVKALEGTCHFDSSPGKGTSVTIEIPL